MRFCIQSVCLDLKSAIYTCLSKVNSLQLFILQALLLGNDSCIRRQSEKFCLKPRTLDVAHVAVSAPPGCTTTRTAAANLRTKDFDHFFFFFVLALSCIVTVGTCQALPTLCCSQDMVANPCGTAKRAVATDLTCTILSTFVEIVSSKSRWANVR